MSTHLLYHSVGRTSRGRCHSGCVNTLWILGGSQDLIVRCPDGIRKRAQAVCKSHPLAPQCWHIVLDVVLEPFSLREVSLELRPPSIGEPYLFLC